MRYLLKSVNDNRYVASLDDHATLTPIRSRAYIFQSSYARDVRAVAQRFTEDYGIHLIPIPVEPQMNPGDFYRRIRDVESGYIHRGHLERMVSAYGSVPRALREFIESCDRARCLIPASLTSDVIDDYDLALGLEIYRRIDHRRKNPNKRNCAAA